MEALEQCKRKDYFQKLMTDINHDSLQLGHQELIAFLYKQVPHIDGM